jgi:hypothetical protein
VRRLATQIVYPICTELLFSALFSASFIPIIIFWPACTVGANDVRAAQLLAHSLHLTMSVVRNTLLPKAATNYHFNKHFTALITAAIAQCA